MRIQTDKVFRGVTTAILLAFTASVLLIFAADAAYADKATLHELFTSAYIRHATRLSLVSSVMATLLSVAVAIPTAYALSRRRFHGIIILDLIVDLLIVMPVLVIGISLLVFFKIGGQLAESHLLLPHIIGMGVQAAGNFFVYTKAGIVLAQFFCAVGFTIRTIKTSFDDIDPRTEKVALTLGCSEWAAFRRITLPMARHGILAGTVLGWLRAFGVFGAVIIVGGAVRNRTEVLPTAIYLEISIGRLEQAIAISLLMVGIATVVLVVLRTIFKASIFGTGNNS